MILYSFPLTQHNTSWLCAIFLLVIALLSLFSLQSGGEMPGKRQRTAEEKAMQSIESW